MLSNRLRWRGPRGLEHRVEEATVGHLAGKRHLRDVIKQITISTRVAVVEYKHLADDQVYSLLLDLPYYLF